MPGWRDITATTCMLLITACASDHRPAPVKDLTTASESYDPLAPPDTYKVRRGDSLWSIAFLYGLDFRELADINQIDNGQPIYSGQTLYLNRAAAPRPQPASQLTKSQLPSRSQSTGQTSKSSVKQAVDRSKAQAYGDRTGAVGRSSTTQPLEQPNQITKWVWPTSGDIIAGFSLKEMGNKGLDITNQIGTPIVAAADGKVVYTGDALRGFGNLVIIRHTDEYLTAYAHNNAIVVKEQQWVTAGDVIAKMGDSGTDRVKLHFEIRFKGRSVDPARYLPKR